MTDAFTPEQQRYLEGLAAGIGAVRAANAPPGAPAEPKGPDASHHKAMARTEARGGKLVNEEKAKRDEHPFDAYRRLKDETAHGQYPKGVDNFRWRFHGLYYVAPNQDSFMCRLRLPNGILTHWQFRGAADLAKRFGGGYTHVTTRANLQIREIKAEYGVPLLEQLAELGLTCKGSGADNIRNVTGAPTAGIDAEELLDTRPQARAWHHHILNDRGLYGLPRKFNVAFDGGGVIPVLEATNDIAFTAVRVAPTPALPAGVEPGIWYRLGLGGITGHMDFARPTGVIVKPEDTVMVADAIVRVYIDNGDRTDRKKARLKYLLDAWGFEKFLAEVEVKLGKPLIRVPAEAITPPSRQDRQAHVGVHPQKQAGLVWVGVVLPVGKMTAAQMRGIADISQQHGDGDIRLTVWQNLLISGVKAADAAKVEKSLHNIGLTSKASAVRAGLVACTGNTGCKFAAADTKGTAMAIADWVEPRVVLDTPINIHLTGCPHSCAQHYIGDIGLLACRVPVAEGSDDTVEGFHVLVGGGFGPDAELAREIVRDVTADQVPILVERLLMAYLADRSGPGETFQAFTKRHDRPVLKALIEAQAKSQNAASQKGRAA